MKTLALGASLLLSVAAVPAHAAFVELYKQDFENPTGFFNDGGDVNIFRTVNQLYGGQPAGFTFAQAFTVETLRVGGSQAWGTGFLDPQGVAGNHVISMLSSAEDDQLALAFNVGDADYLNFRLDIASIDLDTWGGPFVASGGEAPVFRIALLDNPGGATGLGGGTPLSQAVVTGTANPLKNTFDWTNVVVPLSTAGHTNGNVILRIDLLSGGYAAMDNFVVAASDTPGEVPPIPEPGTVALMLGGLAVLGATRARQRRAPRAGA